MPSVAFANLSAGLGELADLQRANPSPSGAAPMRAPVTRAVGRASVVILYSHFERYVRAINEETVLAINAAFVQREGLGERLRLQHSRLGLDEVTATGWEKRERNLEAFVATDAWLWTPLGTGALAQSRLVDWLDSVEPKNLIRYYSMWGIADVFTRVTRRPHTRTALWLRIDELTKKRGVSPRVVGFERGS